MDENGFAALAAKAGVLWVSRAGGPGRPMWFSWHETAVHVVVGGPEQPDFLGPEGAELVLSVPSKDSSAMAVRAQALVVDLHPGTAAWHAAAASLSGKRLNSSVDELTEAWATQARIVRLEVQAVSPEVSADPDGGLQSVDIATVRPRTWRPMRGHARRR